MYKNIYYTLMNDLKKLTKHYDEVQELTNDIRELRKHLKDLSQEDIDHIKQFNDKYIHSLTKLRQDLEKIKASYNEKETT